jgi:hypothetical protein
LTVYDVDKPGSFWMKLDRWSKERGRFIWLQMGKKRWGAEGGIPDIIPKFVGSPALLLMRRIRFIRTFDTGGEVKIAPSMIY